MTAQGCEYARLPGDPAAGDEDVQTGASSSAARSSSWRTAAAQILTSVASDAVTGISGRWNVRDHRGQPPLKHFSHGRLSWGYMVC
jgi:hypothetical protein